MNKKMTFGILSFFLAAGLVFISACAKTSPAAAVISTKTITPTRTMSVTQTQTVLTTPTCTMTVTTTSTVVTVQLKCSGAPSVCGAADTGIIQAAPANNYGSSSVNSVGFSGTGVRRILMKFDVSSIPSGAEITDARLVFTINLLSSAVLPFAVSAHTVNSSWGEDTETWDTHSGGDYYATAQGSASVTSTGSWVIFLDPAVVGQWVSGSLANNGVLLKQDVENTTEDWLSIYMKEDTVEAERPFLQVTYRN